MFVRPQLSAGLPASQQIIHARCNMGVHSPAIMGQDFNQAGENWRPTPFCLCLAACVSLPAALIVISTG